MHLIVLQWLANFLMEKFLEMLNASNVFVQNEQDLQKNSRLRILSYENKFLKKEK